MANEDEQNSRKGSQSSEGIFENLKQRLRSLSHKKGKGPRSVGHSSQSSQGTDAEPPPTLPNSPDLANFPGSPLDLGSPIQQIRRCPSGFFHFSGTCDGGCNTVLPASLVPSDDQTQARRPSDAEFSTLRRLSLPKHSGHNSSLSRTSSDIHTVGSAANLRENHRRGTNSSRQVSIIGDKLVSPDFSRTESYRDWNNPIHPVQASSGQGFRGSTSTDYQDRQRSFQTLSFHKAGKTSDLFGEQQTSRGGTQDPDQLRSKLSYAGDNIEQKLPEIEASLVRQDSNALSVEEETEDEAIYTQTAIRRQEHTPIPLANPQRRARRAAHNPAPLTGRPHTTENQSPLTSDRPPRLQHPGFPNSSEGAISSQAPISNLYQKPLHSSGSLPSSDTATALPSESDPAEAAFNIRSPQPRPDQFYHKVRSGSASVLSRDQPTPLTYLRREQSDTTSLTSSPQPTRRVKEGCFDPAEFASRPKISNPITHLRDRSDNLRHIESPLAELKRALQSPGLVEPVKSASIFESNTSHHHIVSEAASHVEKAGVLGRSHRQITSDPDTSTPDLSSATYSHIDHPLTTSGVPGHQAVHTHYRGLDPAHPIPHAESVKSPKLHCRDDSKTATGVERPHNLIYAQKTLDGAEVRPSSESLFIPFTSRSCRDSGSSSRTVRPQDHLCSAVKENSLEPGRHTSDTESPESSRHQNISVHPDTVLAFERNRPQPLRIRRKHGNTPNSSNNTLDSHPIPQILNMASRPESMMVQGGPREFKKRAIQEATTAQNTIDRWFATNESPFNGKYEFRELIGKGSYGRVYKSIEKATGHLVAIKVLLPDEADSTLSGKTHDINLQDAIREINILERLKQSGATNVNEFIEAGTVHSQLWIVSDYCSGGSLSTLKRAAGNKLEEKYIKVIARELARGLASVHAAGIIHRDIKCGNVMVSENGDLRIIDFGVSGILQSNLEEDKRKTIIGTLHWMAPEIQFQPDGKEVLHGSEVDVWAYGITLYECAMGIPPNATVGQVNRLRAMARQNPPRLPDDKDFSADLKDLVAFCCNADPKTRPSMAQVLKHPYNTGSEAEHPTESLRSLVEVYYLWERSGGNRQSLWQPGGAQQAQIPAVPAVPGQDEWVFSTTVDFDRMHGDADDSGFDLSSSPPREADEWEDTVSFSNTLRPSGIAGAAGDFQTSRADQDAGARRGARFMAGLFDQSAAPYQYGEAPPSDLPLRSGDTGSSLHRKELSVSSNDEGMPAVDLNMSAINQKKADKRATMAWKWSDNIAAAAAASDDLPPSRPALPHAKTFAIGEPVTARQNRETLDMDALMDPGRADARQTLDMDALMDLGRTARQTLDLDDLMHAGEEAPMRSENRETLDLDALLGEAGPGAMPRPSSQVQLARTIGPGTVPQDNRQTLDLDALLMGDAPGVGGAGLEPPVSFVDTEQTMRPASHYPHQQYQQQQVEGHDFAAVAPSHARQPLHQARPGTMDFDALGGGDLDALMAGDHDDPSGYSAAAGADYQTFRPGVADLGLTSSPPTSPFGGPLPGLPPLPEYPAQINPLALHDGAPPELVQAELQRLLTTFSQVLDINHAYLTEASRLAAPAVQNHGPANGHSRATSVASSMRDETSSRDEGAEGDREDE